MVQDISERLVTQFSELITSHLGLFYPKNRMRDLLRSTETVSKELGFENVETCIQSLLSSPLTDKKIDVLIRHLTIGETFFFRDSCVFQAVKDSILPELIFSRDKNGRNISLWSAGCCTGEEPYSIAMLIDQMIPSWESWKITVLATDLNAEFLRKAGRGVYTNWSFRNAPQWIKTRYFKNSGENRFELLARIKKMVTFSQLNLAAKNYSPALYKTKEMDVIFCRNVLMYFSPELRGQIINNFMKILAESGWLILSPSEVPFINHAGLRPVQFPGAIFFRKETVQKKEAVPVSNFPKQDSEQDHLFSITPFAIARKSPSDHSLMTELKEAMTSEVSQFIENEKLKKRAHNSENATQQNLLHEALTLYSEGLYDEAAKKLNTILSLGQSVGDVLSLNPGSMALMARAYANQGKLNEAKEWCMQAIKAEKLLPGHYYLHATICQEQGLIDESINSLKKALYLDQDFILAHFALGNLTQKQGRNDESKKHFKNALSLLLSMNPEEILPYSEGIQAGSLLEVIQSMIKEEKSI